MLSKIGKKGKCDGGMETPCLSPLRMATALFVDNFLDLQLPRPAQARPA
jgi:hypothetical protein